MPTTRTLAIIALGLLLSSPSHVLAAEWITFTAVAEGSFAEGEHEAAQRFSPVRGYLTVPVLPGPHPAVVLLPSCDGLRPYQRSWARALSERGYVALAVDHYFMNDRGQTCNLEDPAGATELLQRRLRHALGAAHYLSGRSEVTAQRLAVMGWADVPVAELLGAAPALAQRRDVFRAGIVVTPTRCPPDTAHQTLPLLVLQSAADATAGGAACEAAAATRGREVIVYAGTRPGFDDPEAWRGPSQRLPSTTNKRRYHRLAHARAVADVAAFLDRELSIGESQSERRYATRLAPAAETGTWAVDPQDAGPDLPPAGGSAFDAVFGRVTPAGITHEVPFPFTQLLNELQEAAGGESATGSPIAATLIPLGRSLQREAAAPDYFASPRVVVAVTDDIEVDAPRVGVPLRNRLFLGYQPRADVIEVISYNEAAGRFEFQIVRDYGPGRTPAVRYARRALCTSCHQNAGPIFADAGWDETTANPHVVRQLAGLGDQFEGVAVRHAERAVAAIDGATNAANLLPVYRRIWSEGCAAPDIIEVARCRAGALQAMVQYRLSAGAGFARSAALYSEHYLPVQRRNWTQRWVDGLLVPSPDLANRSPLMSPWPSSVPAALDPLQPRPPLARWLGSSARDLERMVRGLAGELSERDMRVLDAHLRSHARAAPQRALVSSCSVLRRGLAGRPRLLQIECATNGADTAGFHLRADVRVALDGSAAGQAAWLAVADGSFARLDLAGRLDDGAGPARLVLQPGGEASIGVRAPDGNSLAGLTVQWDDEATAGAPRFPAKATLSLAGDFQPVSTTLQRLAAQATASSPLLAERFDGARLSRWLLGEAGVPVAASCCASRPLPPAQLDLAAQAVDDTSLAVALEHRGSLRTMRRYCGACHGSATTYPPGFLHGTGEVLLSSVRHCAERIYYRLSMWHRPPAQQAVPPMPPAQGLRLAGVSREAWRESESLERLTAYVSGLLADAGRDADALLDGDYHAARSCLAAPFPRTVRRASRTP